MTSKVRAKAAHQPTDKEYWVSAFKCTYAMQFNNELIDIYIPYMPHRRLYLISPLLRVLTSNIIDHLEIAPTVWLTGDIHRPVSLDTCLKVEPILPYLMRSANSYPTDYVTFEPVIIWLFRRWIFPDYMTHCLIIIVCSVCVDVGVGHRSAQWVASGAVGVRNPIGVRRVIWSSVCVRCVSSHTVRTWPMQHQCNCIKSNESITEHHQSERTIDVATPCHRSLHYVHGWPI